MNTNGLARHYETLTPKERLPLIMAASARGDEAERQRLVLSAPTVCYRVPDHFGLAMAFREVSELHFMELLDLAGLHDQAMGMADATDDEKQSARVLDVARLVGYLFKVKLAGWREFCAEYSIDPELCWSCLPGFERVKRAERVAEGAAFTPEGVRAYLRKVGKATELITAEAVVAGLRACLEARAEWWG